VNLSHSAGRQHSSMIVHHFAGYIALIPGVHHFAGYGGRRVGYYHKVRRGNNYLDHTTNRTTWIFTP